MSRLLVLAAWQLPTLAVCTTTLAHYFVEKELVNGTSTRDLHRTIIGTLRRPMIDALAEASKRAALAPDGTADARAIAVVGACVVLSALGGWAAARRRLPPWAVTGLVALALGASATVFRQGASANPQLLTSALGAVVVAGFSCISFMVPAALGLGSTATTQERVPLLPAWWRPPRRLVLWAAPLALVTAAGLYAGFLVADAEGFSVRRALWSARYYAITLPAAELLGVSTYEMMPGHESLVLLPVERDISFSTPSASYTVRVKRQTDAPPVPGLGLDIAEWRIDERRSDNELVCPSGSGPVVGTQDGFLQIRNPAEGPGGRRVYLQSGERVVGWIGGAGTIDSTPGPHVPIFTGGPR